MVHRHLELTNSQGAFCCGRRAAGFCFQARKAEYEQNKTLAAQLYGEFKSFFPENAVEYFVSYYDYYQPEAYVPRTDTYIEKESNINEQIDRMRHSATRALLERDDVIIVASVSCIYGITPEGRDVGRQPARLEHPLERTP